MRYKAIILAGVGVIILVAVFALIFGRKAEDRFSGDIVIWGFEEPGVWREIIAAFESQNTRVGVNYVQKQKDTYEQELLNTLAAGRGPDIFPIHQTWVEKHFEKLAPLPTDTITPAQFRQTFVDVATKDLVRGENVWGLPLYVDTLALYYNRSIFNTAGIVAPPRTWDDFIDVVARVARHSETGEILLAGAAIGTAENVKHAPDILVALMLQSGVQMLDGRGRAFFDRSANIDGEQFNPGEAALSFYTDFSNPEKASYTWSRRQPGSLEAFRGGETAMYLGYAADLEEIEGTNISFATAPFLQIVDRGQDPTYIDLNYADYWALGLNRFSQNPNIAREFMVLATSRNAVFGYLTNTGLPTARRDLIEIQAQQNELLAPFVYQSLTADSWRSPDAFATRDVFSAMIEDVVLGQANVREAIDSGVRSINSLLGT